MCAYGFEKLDAVVLNSKDAMAGDRYDPTLGIVVKTVKAGHDTVFDLYPLETDLTVQEGSPKETESRSHEHRAVTALSETKYHFGLANRTIRRERAKHRRIVRRLL